MTAATLRVSGGPIFDGTQLRIGHVALFVDGALQTLLPEDGTRPDIDLGGDILSPGYADLQVNGGGGVMLGDAPGIDTLRIISKAHRRLGVAQFLPTLITDRPETTRATIAAVQQAIHAQVPGIAGLHLEGPHLSLARKGAHDAGLIRAMTEADLDMLMAAALALPVLKVTIAPENVTPEQVHALAKAGVLVSLGHTDADFDTCLRYVEAGARCVTHLFNAMSPLASRAPGCVGAALGDGRLWAGVIADGIHVHPQTLRTAWAAKSGPGEIFLVSDAMAVAGSDRTGFDLNGRRITRDQGRLTLADGTLAGADLDLTRAIQVMVEEVGVPMAAALRAATSAPRALAGLAPPTAAKDFIRLSPDLRTLHWLTEK
ncbi:N-acetylglucosamine-6-phosphate deacetylase (plasmid) [Aliiroseovarius crassostreae]|uniref:N-acetylglucosamine-6-phosphate deacetylase n=1 Tax=Aliiroseovarius crassostreae TaxID=154981 RepID=UPI0021B0539D|nr:N-acetylglucosamine-6-phosphate deacetylase [Aliiroseovarius crassostreae]UWQ03474.1 N-acetylglucosamine-6-phosphate deacetylase [Aliiroseovarius crassostreae]